MSAIADRQDGDKVSPTLTVRFRKNGWIKRGRRFLRPFQRISFMMPYFQFVSHAFSTSLEFYLQETNQQWLLGEIKVSNFYFELPSLSIPLKHCVVYFERDLRSDLDGQKWSRG